MHNILYPYHVAHVISGLLKETNRLGAEAGGRRGVRQGRGDGLDLTLAASIHWVGVLFAGVV